jgi:hypothetical protein
VLRNGKCASDFKVWWKFRVTVEVCSNTVFTKQWLQVNEHLKFLCYALLMDSGSETVVSAAGFVPFNCDAANDVEVISFRSPSLFYLFTAGVEVVYFNFIAFRHTPQSVGLLWTRDRPTAETSTWHSQETNIHVPGGIRTHDPSKRSAADLRLRSRCHWDRRFGNSAWKIAVTPPCSCGNFSDRCVLSVDNS